MAHNSLQFSNPPLESLQTTHQRFAIRAGGACKYPAEVTPFAAIDQNSPEAVRDLFSLMEPEEATYVIHNAPLVLEGLRCEGPFGVRQMTYSPDLPFPDTAKIESLRIQPLSCANADAMVNLTVIAFPGFFRRRTCEMGNYYGIFAEGRLVAMCGERMAINDYREISGLCTHPEFRGRGYAQILMAQLMHDHREAGLKSYLHVAATNTNAIALYERMGFTPRGEFPIYRVTREA